MRGVYAIEQRAHLVLAENGGQARFAPRPQVVKELPVAPEHLHEVEADPAVANAQGVGGPTIDVLAVQEVRFQFGFGDRLGRLVGVELAKHTQRPGVGFLGALGLAVKRQ
jgi:hypothetical protein